MWKTIAFACRYGHQDLLAIVGEVTTLRVMKFCDALKYWLESERKNGRTHAMSIAEGG